MDGIAMAWTPLPKGNFGATAKILGVDANFVWADRSGFRDFLRPGEMAPRAVPVLIELVPGGKDGLAPLQAFITEIGRHAGCEVTPVAPDLSDTRYCTAMLSADCCVDAFKAGSKLGRLIERMELQLPVIPQRPRPKSPATSTRWANPARVLSSGELLLGLIDSGCAFAHEYFRGPGREGTRLLHIWDQDDEPAFSRPPLAGGRPPDLRYGCEASRELLAGIMAASRDGGGSVDEAACYELAGDQRLRHRFTHGTAVLSLLACPQRWLPLDEMVDVDRPADSTASPGSEMAAEAADIVFVQLPRDVVQDSSSAGLSRSILDGLRYIVSCAGPDTKRIVVNLSDGSSRGTHDGHSIIEMAMLELIAQQRSLGRTLSIVVAAGNSYDEERHAQFDKLEHDTGGSLTLRVPPGSEAPFFVNIVLPPEAGDVRIRVTPPGESPKVVDFVETAQSKGWPVAESPACAIVNPKNNGSTRCALIALAPTASSNASGPIARSGDWQIDLRSKLGLSKTVHLYIPRTQSNPGALRRALQARFIDTAETYDERRHLRAWEVDQHGSTSPLRRAGTLSSLATVPDGRGILVAGSYVERELVPSPYSSEGPALPRLGEKGQRKAPDFLAVTDMSRALRGLNAAGTFSGDRVRVVGTSFAAPQVARAVADGGAVDSVLIATSFSVLQALTAAPGSPSPAAFEERRRAVGTMSLLPRRTRHR